MEIIWTCDSILYILNNMWRLMKHIIEKKVLFYWVIVRTFWMTLVIGTTLSPLADWHVVPRFNCLTLLKLTDLLTSPGNLYANPFNKPILASDLAQSNGLNLRTNLDLRHLCIQFCLFFMRRKNLPLKMFASCNHHLRWFTRCWDFLNVHFQISWYCLPPIK